MSAVANHSVSTGPPTVPRCSATGLLPSGLFPSPFSPFPSPFRGRAREGVGGHLNPGRRSPSLCNQLIDLHVRKVVVISMVDSSHRRVLARPHAFPLFVREEPVARNLPRLF